MISSKEISEQIKYDYLVKNDLIPEILPLIDVSQKKYPSFVYAKNKELEFENYLFNVTNYFLLSLSNDVNINDLKKYFPLSNRNLEDFFPKVEKILNSLNRKWNECNFGEIEKFNYNIIDENPFPDYKTVTGFVNCVTNDCIINIITTNKIKSTIKKQIIDILSSFSISPKNIKRIAFIFPLQHEIRCISLENWDNKNFLNLIRSFSPKNDYSMNKKTEALNYINEFRIGTYIHEDKLIKKTVTNTIPYQIMFSSNENIKTINSKLEKISGNYQYFIHGPYTVNLCRENISNNFINLLISATHNQCSGVVIHVGKHLNMDKIYAFQNMVNNFKKLLEYSTENCPIILETPCGCGTELLYTYEEMIYFFSLFNYDELKKMGLCIDTAHIYSAGYNIVEYCDKVINLPIKLIHFNDSGSFKGSFVDIHKLWGEGKIPFRDLFSIAVKFDSMNIPMIIE